MKTQRRTALKKMFASFVGVAGLGLAASAKTNPSPEKEAFDVTIFQDVPMFSGYTKFGNLVFISGRGQRLEGDIRVHTDNVLKIMESELKKAGSSMEKVLKVTIFLEDIKDYDGMNETYKGRFGKKPPARTTVAVGHGLPPADNLIQMDCIAYI
ncbi:MAG: RidA family protein [Bacteroidales bacterium]|nr:RidA family protein [Bacteroidales bacterium]